MESNIPTFFEHNIRFLSYSITLCIQINRFQSEGLKCVIFSSLCKGSLTVWALYAYFSDPQNAALELLVWCM